MRLALIATAFLLPLMAAAPSVPAQAAAPNKPSDAARKAALALNEKLQFVGQVNVILTTVRGQIIVALARSNNKAPDQIQPAVDELLMPDFTGRANDLAGLIVDEWATAFTVEELRGMVEFYNSPLGQKMLKTMPALSSDVNKEASAWVQSILAESMPKHAAAFAQRGIKTSGEGAPKSGP